jgi:hypothetical protein
LLHVRCACSDQGTQPRVRLESKTLRKTVACQPSAHYLQYIIVAQYMQSTARGQDHITSTPYCIRVAKQTGSVQVGYLWVVSLKQPLGVGAVRRAVAQQPSAPNAAAPFARSARPPPSPHWSCYQLLLRGYVYPEQVRFWTVQAHDVASDAESLCARAREHTDHTLATMATMLGQQHLRSF